MVLTLLLPITRRLKLGRNQKYMLIGIFCLGFFTCTISFVRIKYLKLTKDATWDNVDSSGRSVGEFYWCMTTKQSFRQRLGRQSL